MEAWLEGVAGFNEMQYLSTITSRLCQRRSHLTINGLQYYNLSNTTRAQTANRRTVTYMISVAVAVTGLSYAAVPLYRLYCQVIRVTSSQKSFNSLSLSRRLDMEVQLV